MKASTSFCVSNGCLHGHCEFKCEYDKLRKSFGIKPCESWRVPYENQCHVPFINSRGVSFINESQNMHFT